MDIIFLLIPLSLILVSIGVWAFFWAVNNDQLSDLEQAGQDILIDDEDEPYESLP